MRAMVGWLRGKLAVWLGVKALAKNVIELRSRLTDLDNLVHSLGDRLDNMNSRIQEFETTPTEGKPWE